ncbi:hypothetical protein BV25DRAFT_1919919 [Artomyces pyxidatus]|uniref:Uncharacterized protein n=1 Tax=Artomyces pyxidatus TaxID=48021 RepID=A0ACB8SPN8_9AGAM|nr:hypothetical protein BV25DRAFT_1919919 [Artomyces pyxidatus]
MLLLLSLVYASLVDPSSSLPAATVILTNRTPDPALTDAATACDSIHGCRTLDNIIWSSVVTIFACVWTAVHRNIQGPSTGRITRILDLIRVVVVTLLVPEWVLAWAVRQWLNARTLGKDLERARGKAQRSWRERGELKDAWVGEEGSARRRGSAGARREEDDQDEKTPSLAATPASGESDEEPPATSNKHALSPLATEGNAGRLLGGWTTRHGFFIIMGGFHVYKDGKPIHPISPVDAIELVKSGVLVPPTEDEIRGWSQGDVLSKAIAILQTLWFVIQCIARRAEGLPITQLEVMTLAYTTITVAMYAFWWYKPLNVSGPVRVSVETLPESEPSKEEEWYYRIFDVMTGTQDVLVDLRRESRVPTFYGGDGSRFNEITSDVVALFVAMVFGAVHCAAWNYIFPSIAEQHIWRISSAAIVAVPAAMLVALLLSFGPPEDSAWGPVGLVLFGLIFTFSGPVYIAARSLLLALSFTTLRSLPAEAYETVQWTLRIPHFT